LLFLQFAVHIRFLLYMVRFQSRSESILFFLASYGNLTFLSLSKDQIFIHDLITL
jgi:hypothetical protein